MSTVNPLDEYTNVTVKYILVAFAYTEDACRTNIDAGVGPAGRVFTGSGCGKPAVVIVNDFVESKKKSFFISKYENDFSFYGSLTPSTTQMLGSLTITDRYGGYFPTFLSECTKQLQDVSETHVAFALRVFFIGTKTVDS